MKDLFKRLLDKLDPAASAASAPVPEATGGFNAVGRAPIGAAGQTETATQFRVSDAMEASLTSDRARDYVFEGLSDFFDEHAAGSSMAPADNPFAGIKVPYLPKKARAAAAAPLAPGEIELVEERPDGSQVKRRFVPQAAGEGAVELVPLPPADQQP